MKKIYIIVDACSGPDYSTDDPTILFVTIDEKEARDFFDDEISNWEDGLEDFDSNVDEYADGTFVYECSNFDDHSHRVMKLVEKEIN